jgi:beta-glucosidase-like glycosyl hydrolase
MILIYHIQSFESFSEDPYLSGIISAAYINGVQKGGIGATIKHFVYVQVHSGKQTMAHETEQRQRQGE